MNVLEAIEKINELTEDVSSLVELLSTLREDQKNYARQLKTIKEEKEEKINSIKRRLGNTSLAPDTPIGGTAIDLKCRNIGL